MSDKWLARILLFPTIIFFIALIFYPICKVLSYSLYSQHIYELGGKFCGLQNFKTILLDKRFWISFLNSSTWTFGSVIIQIVLGLLVALFLNEEFLGRNIARSAVLFSYIIPTIVAVIVWKFMLHDATGIINYVIRKSHLPIPTTWFASPKTAMLSVIIVNVWKFFPFIVIVILAQLQSIDITLYEAARVDGSNRWQEFIYITLPSIKPVLYIAALLRTIWTFKNFDVIALLTGGGPIYSTETIPLRIYSTVIEEFSLGRGSTVASLMFFIILIMAIFYLYMYKRAERELY